ncbi:MAG: FtsB family cell division protein [Gemmatimonadales bacterium]
MTRARWIAVAAMVAAALFAWFGGSYSEPNYRALMRDVVKAKRDSAVLQRSVDSLRSFRDSLANYPAVQERVARQVYGMVRPGELMFLIAPADSGRIP